MSSIEAGVRELASPLPYLISEEARGDREATEAVFLTFGVDLGFFERTVLGVCRSAGARVTVISDASIYAPDPRAATQAGIAYVPGLAQMQGAFHPKLLVLVGPTRAVVAVGSGNLTLPGWQFNSEIWTIKTVAEGRGPHWLSSLADWLHRLPGQVRIGSQAGQGLRRAAEQLQSLARGVDHHGEQSFVHNLDEPIIQQLPEGPVDELRLYAPFHDPDGAAVSELLERMKPKRAWLAIQPGKTVTSAQLLGNLQSKHGLTVISDDLDDRYRHGKLVEWRLGNERWSLTGSPNLSRSALLRTVSDGGNCEIGLIAPIESTIFPDGHQLEPEELQQCTFPTLSSSAATKEQRATILEVLISDGQTLVSLGLAVQHPVLVEYSNHTEDPDSWTELGSIPPGEMVLRVGFRIPPGSRVRVTTSGSAATHLAFATNPASVRHRPLQGPAPGRKHYLPEKLLGDATHLQAFLRDVEDLSAALAATRLPAPSTGSMPSDEAGEPQEPISWLDYLDQTEGTYGHELTRYAYALPQVSGPGLMADVDIDWVDRLADDAVADLEDDSAEVEVDQSDPPEESTSQGLPNFKTAVDTVRRRFRTWISDLVAKLDQLGPTERLIGTRLVLHAVAGHLWDIKDDQWFETLTKAASTLRVAPTQPHLGERFANLAGVALAVLNDATPIRPSTDRTIQFERLVKALLPLSASLNPDLLESYVEGVSTIDGRTVTPDMVMELVHGLENPDHLENAVSALQEQGFDAHSHSDSMIHIRGASAPWFASVSAVAAATGVCPVLAWAEDPKGKWEMAVWSPPRLYRGRGVAGMEPVTWDSFGLTELFDIKTLAEVMRNDPNKASEYRLSGLKRAVREMPPEVRQILSDIGLHRARPPVD